ncbi:MAG: alpha/beta hydrolase [Fimbriimonadaceae bacterium]
MPQKKRWRKLFYFAIGLLLVYGVVVLLLARSYVYPVRRETPPVEPPLVESTLPGPGYNIPVWATPALAEGRPEAPVVFLLVHGYGGRRSDWSNTAPLLAENGYEVLVPAMKGQTESESAGVGFGLYEAEELIVLAEQVQEMYPGEPKIVLGGISMGGAAAWIAAGKRPDLFDAVVTEAAFARLDWATKEFLTGGVKGSAFLFKPMTTLASRMSGIHEDDVRPFEWAQKFDGPAIVIHGDADRLIGLRHAELLAESSGAELKIIPDLRHAQMDSDNPDLYFKILKKMAD